jgi:hypothetical protein
VRSWQNHRAQRERHVPSPDVGIAEIPTPAIVFLDQAHTTHSYDSVSDDERTPPEQDALDSVPGSRSELLLVPTYSYRGFGVVKLATRWVPKCLRRNRCFCCSFVGESEAHDAGHRASGYVPTKRWCALSSPYNGSGTHPTACPHTPAARRIASRCTRRFSAGPSYGTWSGAEPSWAAPCVYGRSGRWFLETQSLKNHGIECY